MRSSADIVRLDHAIVDAVREQQRHPMMKSTPKKNTSPAALLALLPKAR
jgi:hypothetical protein